jgi:hypothetical protein
MRLSEAKNICTCCRDQKQARRTFPEVEVELMLNLLVTVVLGSALSFERPEHTNSVIAFSVLFDIGTLTPILVKM